MELRYGTIRIHLKDNLSYQWTVEEAGCVRGYAYVEERLLEGRSLLSYLAAASTQEEMLEKIIIPYCKRGARLNAGEVSAYE